MVHHISQKHQQELYSLLDIPEEDQTRHERFVACVVLYLLGASFEDTSPIRAPRGGTAYVHGLPWTTSREGTVLVAVYPLEEAPASFLGPSKRWQYWTYVIIGFLLEKYAETVRHERVAQLQAALEQLDAPTQCP